MLIAHVITSYHPIVGGAERQLAQLGRRMADKGHDLRVITRRHADLAREEIVNGVPVLRVGSGGAKQLAAAGFLVGAISKLRSLKPDVIHCHSLWSPAVAGSIAGSMTGAALLAKPMRSGEAERIAGKPLGKQRLTYLFRTIDAFPAVSDDIGKELVELGVAPHKIHRVPNGVDTGRYRKGTADERSSFRAGLGLAEDNLLVAYAGRLSRQKSLPTLIEAWRAIAEQVPSARLLVAEAQRVSANDTEEAEISAALDQTPQVVRLGHVDDMPALLSAADVFVLPSAQEGLSNALLEACASGLACVASDIAGNRELIEGNKTGMLFPVGSEGELGQALKAVLGDAAMRAQLGSAARSKVENGFSIDRTVDDLLDLYASLRSAGDQGRAGFESLGVQSGSNLRG